MKICVLGLYHLGTVTAACLASQGFDVVGLDKDKDVVAACQQGKAPLYEPDLDSLITHGVSAGRLFFTTDPELALEGADVVWVCFDTPVDEDDTADVQYVVDEVRETFEYLNDSSVVLISSQVSAGTVTSLRESFESQYPDKNVEFAYSPENLRLGKAIKAFTEPARIVVGVAGTRAQKQLAPLMNALCSDILWMRVESAEMVKHALNSFLATCITFTNEIASLCEVTGADASEVEIALRKEPRIGSKAYVRPGPAFGGGTLARDVRFLRGISRKHDVELPLLSNVLESNELHKFWALRKLKSVLGSLEGQRICVLGVAYKPGTSSIRRSVALNLCRSLVHEGACVQVFDPHVDPKDLAKEEGIECRANISEAVKDCAAIVIGTPWENFKELSPESLPEAGTDGRCLVLDESRLLDSEFSYSPRVAYYTVGTQVAETVTG